MLKMTDLNISGCHMVGMAGMVDIASKPHAIDFCILWEFAPWRRGWESAFPRQSLNCHLLDTIIRHNHYMCIYIYIYNYIYMIQSPGHTPPPW